MKRRNNPLTFFYVHFCLLPWEKTTILAKSPWDTRQKHSQNWAFMKNALRKSVALSDITLFWSLPSPFLPQAMLKVPAMILGVKRASNQHCIGGGGGMHEFAVFLQKCPKTFGQDCRLRLSSCQAGHCKNPLCP